MKPNVPQSRRKADSEDPGYRPRQGSRAYMFLHLLDNVTEPLEEPTAQTISECMPDYISDVLDQYTCRHYADEDPLLVGEVIYRLSRMYEMLITANLPHIDPRPETIEGVLDDIYALDGETFCAKYNISDFFEMVRTRLEAEVPKDDYSALARHLNPDGPAAGFTAIDTQILANLRYRHKLYNLQHLARLAATAMIMTGTILSGFPLLLKFMAQDIAADRLPGFVAWFAGFDLAWWAALLFMAGSAAIAVGLLWLADRLAERWRTREHEQAMSPATSRWLKANDKQHRLDYRHEIHWPRIKVKLHSKSFLGFTFFRDRPLTLTEYEAIVRRYVRRGRYDYRTHLIADLAADMRKSSR